MNSGSASPIDLVGSAKRRRADTPSSSGLCVSGRMSVLGTDGNPNRLKKQLADAQRQIVDANKQLALAQTQISTLEEREKLLAQVEQTKSVLSNHVENGLKKQVEAANEMIRDLREQLQVVRADLAALEEELSVKDSRLEELSVEIDRLRGNDINSNNGEPSQSTQTEEDLKTETELIIPEDEFIQVEANTVDVAYYEPMSTTSVLDSEVPASGERKNQSRSVRVSSSECDAMDREVQSYAQQQEIILVNSEDSEVNSTSQSESNPITVPDTSSNVLCKDKRSEVCTENLPLRTEQVEDPLPTILVGAATGTEERSSMHKNQNASKNPWMVKLYSTEEIRLNEEMLPAQEDTDVKEVIIPKIKSIKVQRKDDTYQIAGKRVIEIDLSNSDTYEIAGKRVIEIDLSKSDSDTNCNPIEPSHSRLSAQTGDHEGLLPNCTANSPSEAGGQSHSSLSHSQSNQWVLVEAGDCYCCLVSERFLKVDWKKFYRRKSDKDASYGNRWACRNCNEDFKIRRQMEDHVWIQHYDENFFCPHCPDFTVLPAGRSVSGHAKREHRILHNNTAFRTLASIKHNLTLQPPIPNPWRKKVLCNV